MAHPAQDLDEPSPHVTRVCQGLYLGGAEAALDLRLHRRLNFSLVVNCTSDIGFVRHRAAGARYIKVPVEDNLAPKQVERLARLLPGAVAAIHGAIERGGSVLVHCRLGRQRSAAVAAAYLMFCDGMSPDDAMRRVAEARPTAFQPEANFAAALAAYHCALGLQRPDQI
jgi:protein-tyrosine phosphatase